MYGRTNADRTLSFGHEGVLFRNSFVMYDKETGSLWVHTTGRSVSGPLRGRALEFLPSTVTRWSAWRQDHPETKVLLGRRATGFMGTFGAQGQLERYGLALRPRDGAKATLYPYTLLQERQVAMDPDAPEPVVVVFDPETVTAIAFAAEIEGTRLVLEPTVGEDGARLMRDQASGTVWSRDRGECVAGPAKGKRLRQVPATPWLIERWRGFYPDGRVFGADRRAF